MILSVLNNIMNEMWKEIEKTGGKYFVSNFGQIKNRQGKIKNQRKQNSGYYIVDLFLNGKNNTHLVHRIVASAFCENTENKKTVNHIDRNKENNRYDNLEWLSIGDNVRYSIHLRNQNGIKNHKAIFTEDDIRHIRSYLSLGFTVSSIARAYRCSFSAINKIKKKITWRHIEGAI